MNPLLERQAEPCPMCNGEGVLSGRIIGANIKNFTERCYKCGGKKTVLESPISYRQRLVRMIEYAVTEATRESCNYCHPDTPRCPGLEQCIDDNIQEAFNKAKESTNDK